MRKALAILIASLIGTSFVPFSRIEASSNVGVMWIKYSGNPLNLGVNKALNPWVIYDGQMFKMWYAGREIFEKTLCNFK
jgi:hypothetical protein